MTAAAHRGPSFRSVVLRAPTGPRVVTVRHAHRRLRLWRRRIVLGSALGGAMVGALLGVGLSIRELGTSQPLQSLTAYGIGAGAGLVAGLLLGVLLSVLFGLIDRYLLPHRVPTDRTWVRHQR